MMSSEVAEVMAKLQGKPLEKVYDCCQHVEGSAGGTDYGFHGEPSGVWVITTEMYLLDKGYRIMPPCKTHLSRYLSSKAWEILE